MKRIFRFCLWIAVCALLSVRAWAGHAVQPPKPVEAPERRVLPEDAPGDVNFGLDFSSKLVGGYMDALTGLWISRDRDSFLFLESCYHFLDNGQFNSSTGLGYRKLLNERQVILGANAFWDLVNSERGNDFNQLGLGAELLTRWVDARFNYYLPEDKRFEVSRRSSGSGSGRFARYEGTLQGFNAEIGFLVPGLDRFTEVRLFAGYYYYDNPFGRDFQGFKARMEAHLLPGLVAEVEYWDDAELMGGHWTAGARVTVPFSIYNLARGRNPFEGAGEFFKPRTRKFEERMGEMAMRSRRLQTVTSGEMR